MPEGLFANIDREVNPFSRANTSRRGLHIEIKLENEKSVNSFTTFDVIKGAVTVTADTKTSLDGIMISFEGSSRTSIEQPSVVAPTVGKSTAFHTFLRLVQPMKQSQFPEGGHFLPNEEYTFPFTFVVPEHLLPQACAHEHSFPQVHDAHVHLPPSLGDPTVSGNGQSLLNDLSPDACHIQYVIRVQLVRNTEKSDAQALSYHEGSRSRHVRVIASANKRVRVVPATDEEPPLLTEDLEETEYCLRKEKETRKGTLRGRSGFLVIAAAQPRAFKIKNVKKEGDAPPTTVVNVNLRFDPADAKQKPPKLDMLNTRLKANTFYSAVPWTNFPQKTIALRWDSKKGVYTETVPLTSMRVANATWTYHEPTSPGSPRLPSRRNTSATSVRPDMRRSYSANSAVSALSADTDTSSSTSLAVEDPVVDVGVPGPALKADPSLPYYTTSIVVPLVLAQKSKAYLPTFHSCLTSRTYVLDIALSYHAQGKTPTTIINAPTISLKVPVQITTDISLREISEMSVRDREAARESRAVAREARRERIASRIMRTGAAPNITCDMDEFFRPRPVGPMAAIQSPTNTYAPARARGLSSAGPLYRSSSINSTFSHASRSRRPTASEDILSPLVSTTPSFDPSSPFDPTGSLRSRRNRANTVSSTHSAHSDMSSYSNASTLPPEYSNRPDVLIRRLLSQRTPTAQS